MAYTERVLCCSLMSCIVQLVCSVVTTCQPLLLSVTLWCSDDFPNQEGSLRRLNWDSAIHPILACSKAPAALHSLAFDYKWRCKAINGIA